MAKSKKAETKQTGRRKSASKKTEAETRMPQSVLIGRFADDCLRIDPKSWVTVEDLYEAYVRWLPGDKFQPYPDAFEKAIENFFQPTLSKSKVAGRVGYAGVRLLPSAEWTSVPYPEGYEPGSLGCHEALHMASVLHEMVEERLCGHATISSNGKWLELAREARDKLDDLYNAIGEVHIKDDEEYDILGGDEDDDEENELIGDDE